jgi:hypothetical protein
LRYHDPENWPLLREALKSMGRADLIGNGKQHLVPNYQPVGTGKTGGEGMRKGRKFGGQTFLTKYEEQGRKPRPFEGMATKGHASNEVRPAKSVAKSSIKRTKPKTRRSGGD